MAETTTWTASPFVTEIAPITECDEEIRRNLVDAEIQPLLPALACATGDMSLLRDELRPDPLAIALTGGFTDQQAAAVRELALDALARYRDGGCRPAPVPFGEDVLRIMELAVAGAEMADYLPLLEEELAHRGRDRRAPTWHKDELAPDVEFRVVVVGALLLSTGQRAVEVCAAVHDEFNAAVDAANRRMAWGVSDVNTWCRNASGRIAQNWPFTLLEYWRRTPWPDPADDDLTR